MALAKNAAKSAEAETKKPAAAKAEKAAPKTTKPAAAKAEPKVTKPASKPAAKAPTPVEQADATPASLTKADAPKIGRKELALAIRAKVTKSGAAVSPKVAEICTIAYEEAIAEALAAGQEVNLPGFGKFVVLHREAGEKRNPATNEKVMVPASKQAKFRVGAKLKQVVNGGAEPASDEDSE